MTILITGSQGIIGLHIVKYFKKNGNEVLELDKKIGIDATDEDSVNNFFKANKHKNITTIINCIGIPDAVPLKTKNILDINIPYFKKMIDINLNSVFIIVKECYRFNKNSLKNIINISSLYSIVSPRLDLYNGMIKNPAYTASKHGLIGLTKHLAIILSDDKILVNSIAPGAVYESIDPKNETFIQKYINNVPLKQMTYVDDIINTMMFLINSKSITGQNIVLDGGYSII